jgi:Holliday junction resolvasome RuvABC endonuclease subunit
MIDLLALDIATMCGWARGRVGEAPACGWVRFSKPGASQLAICGRAFDWAIETIKDPLPDMVAIEALLPPAVTRGRSNVDHDLLAMLHGVIMAVCFKRGVYNVHKYAVQSVRAHFIDLSSCRKGEAKTMVMRKCATLGWLAANDNDAADACALWSYQAALIDPMHAVRVSPLFGHRKAHASHA